MPTRLGLLGLALFLAGALGCSSCATECASVAALPSERKILAIGDSILAWSGDRCQSIPDHTALALGNQVTNRAVNGARLLGGDAERPAIPEQYVDGDWDWVIVDGGGNDLNSACGCGDCARVLDAIVTEDATGGAMVDLIDRITARGARVLLVDYFVLHEGAWYGFDRCEKDLATLDARYVTLDGLRDDVVLVDLGDVVSPEAHPEAYAFDNVHPTDEGAKLLGPLIANAIK